MPAHSKVISSVNGIKADDDGFSKPECQYKGIAKGEILEGLSEWCYMACMKRSIENLGEPIHSSRKSALSVRAWVRYKSS